MSKNTEFIETEKILDVEFNVEVEYFEDDKGNIEKYYYYDCVQPWSIVGCGKTKNMAYKDVFVNAHLTYKVYKDLSDNEMSKSAVRMRKYLKELDLMWREMKEAGEI